MHDDTVFCDEQQRIYVFTNIFMTLYFDCRSVFLFDIKSQFANNDHVCNLFKYITVTDKLNNDDEDFKFQNNENNMN